MHLSRYPHVDSFVQAAHAFLERDEPVNNFVAGTALRLRDAPGASPWCATVEDAGAVVAAVLLTAHELLLAGSSPTGLTAIDPIVATLHQEQATVAWVFAPVPLAGRFAAQWATIRDVASTPDIRRRAWALWQVTHPRAISGQLRPAQADDTELVADWLWAFDHEALAGGATRIATVAVAQRRIAAQEVFVWDDGQPVAMAGTTRPTWHGIGVNAVYTPPALRGRGYATACVAALSQRLLDGGVQFCTLFTDPANPVSEAIYAKLGYRPLAEFAGYTFSRTDPA
jgi:predicted GNAT family acetyltransferase